MRRRLQILGEIAMRLVLMVVVFAWLPTVFAGDIRHFLRYANVTSRSNLPYRNYTYEFPPLTLVFLALRIPFRSYTAYRWAFGIVMMGFEFGSLCLLRRAWPQRERALNVIWYASVLPIALLGWFRFDFPAVFFATIAIIAMEKRRPAAWAIVAGFATKLWPATLIASLVVKRRWRDVATAVAGCAVFVVAWIAWSPSGFKSFLKFRGGVGLEVESLLASFKMVGTHAAACHPARVACHGVGLGSGAWVIDAGGWKWVGPAMYLILGVYAVAVIAMAYRRRNVDAVALAGALTLASFLISRIISAQYIVWTAPFVAVVWARGNKRVGWLSIGSSLFTVLYLLWFDPALVRHGNQLVAGVVLVRNLFLIALLVELTRAIFVAPSGDDDLGAADEPVAAAGESPASAPA